MAWSLRVLMHQRWGEPVARFATAHEAESYRAFLVSQGYGLRGHRVYFTRKPINAAMVQGKLMWVQPRGPGP
jgi:hypothetical protein